MTSAGASSQTSSALPLMATAVPPGPAHSPLAAASQVTAGPTVSCTTKVASSLSLAPSSSVTVSVIVWLPRAKVPLGMALVGSSRPSAGSQEKVMVSPASGSIELEPLSATSAPAGLVHSKTPLSGSASATGGEFSDTAMSTKATCVAPWVSVTRSATV